MELFCKLGTQWRASVGGLTGLDYNVLYHKLDRMGLSPEDYDRVEMEIGVMERAALDTMNKKK